MEMDALARLAGLSEQLGDSGSRLQKIQHIAAYFESLPDSALPLAVRLLSGMLPTLGVGYATLAALPELEPGPGVLSLAELQAGLEEIGADARRKAKLEGLTRLLSGCDRPSQHFLRRLLVGELRQGAQAGLVLEGLARACQVSIGELRTALTLAGDPGEVAEAARRGQLDRFHIQVFRPLAPMLASPAQDVEEVFSRHPQVWAEWKLDGARIQVHRLEDEVRVYSRNLREVTAAVPEVVESVLAWKCRRCVVDGEVIALHEDGRPRPFQETMRRFGRRSSEPELRLGLPLTAYFFDCLDWDGEALLNAPLEQRRQYLPDRQVPARRCAGVAELEEFLAEALAHGHEGIMAKDPWSDYGAGSRGFAWLKLKPARTLDLVVLAAEWGSGRRRGWLSNLHLGCYDPDRDRFVMLGKTFKGLTDQMLEWQTGELLARETGREGHVVHVRPELVVEIAFNEVQLSPHYPGGLALRFARVKHYRPDKSARQADTLATVQSLSPMDRK